jgi:hypothetical protein
LLLTWQETGSEGRKPKQRPGRVGQLASRDKGDGEGGRHAGTAGGLEAKRGARLDPEAQASMEGLIVKALELVCWLSTFLA